MNSQTGVRCFGAMFRNASKMFPQLIGAMMFLSLPGVAQGQERTISKMSWPAKEPVKIVKLKTKGKVIELGKEFYEKDDWLKGLTVTVENVSDKPISRIVLDLSFPRPGGFSETIPTYAVKLIYGRDPADEDAGEHKLVLFGESVDIRMLDVKLPFIKTDLEKLSYPEKTTRAQLMVQYVTFSDGAMWTGDDNLLYPDPSDPQQKINPRFSLPEKVEAPPGQAALPCPPSAPLFPSAGFRRADAPAMRNHGKVPFRGLGPLQDETLPCTTAFVITQYPACGAIGSGCTRLSNIRYGVRMATVSQ